MTELERRRNRYFEAYIDSIENMVTEAIKNNEFDTLKKFGQILKNTKHEMEKVETDCSKREV